MTQEMLTKGEDTRVVNFSLDERSRVEVTKRMIRVGNVPEEINKK